MDESFKMVKYWFKVPKTMNRLVIPSILAATVLIAGIFVFMPVQKASTVHTGLSGLSEDLVAVTVADTDLVIECPTASRGCHILEVFIDEDEAGANDLDLGAVTATIDGEAVTVVADLATLVDDITFTVPNVSGFALGSGDIVTIVVENAASESIDYKMRVVAVVSGGSSIDARI